MDRGQTNLETDHALMCGVRAGALEGMAALYERHGGALFGYFYRQTGSRAVSEDLTQEVFLKMLRSRDTYANDGQFTPWMYRIARNVHVDTLRKGRFEVHPEEDSMPEPVSSERNPQQQVVEKERIDLLRKALSLLPEEKRELLILSRYQGLKYEQIAEILNCEVGAVKLRVYRAVKHLQQIYCGLAGERA